MGLQSRSLHGVAAPAYNFQNVCISINGRCLLELIYNVNPLFAFIFAIIDSKRDKL